MEASALDTKERMVERQKEIGKGKWGIVYSGRWKGRKVAIKDLPSLFSDGEGVNYQVIREVKMLRDMSHPNVMNALDIVIDESVVSIVFELMKTDLEKVLYEDVVMSLGEAKGFCAMLLEGLEFLHSNFIYHRDIKPANLLVSSRGVLKIADFGYARYAADANCPQSHECCTLWYRPPELLFGSTEYDASVDVWSAGCVILEIGIRRPAFQGTNDLDQLAKIFQICGTPTELQWPGVTSLKKYVAFASNPKNLLSDLITHDLKDPLRITQSGSSDKNELRFAALVTSLLAVDPKVRSDCATALKDTFFSLPPRPALGNRRDIL